MECEGIERYTGADGHLYELLYLSLFYTGPQKKEKLKRRIYVLQLS